MQRYFQMVLSSASRLSAQQAGWSYQEMAIGSISGGSARRLSALHQNSSVVCRPACAYISL